MLVTNYLENWPYGILTEKATLRIPLIKNKQKNEVKANLHFCAAHRWTKPASKLVSWLFQYNNSQHREEHRLYSQMKTPVLPHLFPPTSTCFHRLSSTDGQGGGTPGCFPKSIRFFLTHIKPAGWRHVRTWRWWMRNGRTSGTSVSAEEQ